ncbi:MAG TPA: serine/threonine protein kinase, partial [Thermoanaerobaculia bacterium]|nr:serine/threonine protein kinase [Thermoanaerobaculia bacterium]
MDPIRERMILRLAVEQGLLEPHETGLDQAEEPSFSRLRSLLSAGRLSAAQVERLSILIDSEETLFGEGVSPTGPPPDLPPALRDWDRYQIRARLGSGGMGEVYSAWDPQLQRMVALKFLYRSDPKMVGRFVREAQSQARVDHARVCRIYEVGTIED